ncbi:thermonuclease family protein [Lactiplantibacillus plantarum]|uniref:thermonuclease family protein n=1 Tax=Lactiplantibacillus plantarum TaxID=1590 RepID=UPI001BA7E635|nr:thermonuclease family protein [Lactiplantibacillus plantarum]MBS0954960.1 thermonuclease family protein [Lactiplantibacillus plantarum]
MQKKVWPTFLKVVIITIACSLLVVLLMLRTSGFSKSTSNQASSISNTKSSAKTAASSTYKQSSIKTNSNSSTTGADYKVVTVNSGDSFKITKGTHTSKIKLLLVQSPSVKFKSTSRKALSKLILGQKVRLQYDSNADEHQPYVYVHGKLVQTALLKQGDVIISGANTTEKHYQAFKSAQDSAQKASKGVWSYPGLVNDNGYNND